MAPMSIRSVGSEQKVLYSFQEACAGHTWGEGAFVQELSFKHSCFWLFLGDGNENAEILQV